MANDVIYPIISILVVLIVAAGIYYLADMMGATGIHHEDGGHEGAHEEGHEEEAPPHEEGSNAEAEELFFAAMDKPLQYDEYIFAYTETASNGYADSVFISSSGTESYVKKEDAIFTRELFIGKNKTVLCLENVNRVLCTEVEQNSSFNPYVYTLSSLLYDSDKIRKNKENNELLIEYGAIVFHSRMPTKTYGERECIELSYTLDYSKLTVEQMRIIGMSPQTPEVLLSKEYNFTLCIDPENHDVVHKSLSYLNFGSPESTESITTQAEWGEVYEEFVFPTDISEDVDMNEFYQALKMSQTNYANCLLDENFDSCISSEALLSKNERLCELVTSVDKRDQCYLMVALDKGSPLICEYISPEVQDDCYIEFAWKYKDTIYCGKITNITKQDECLNIVTEPEEGDEIIEEMEDGLPINETLEEELEEGPAQEPENPSAFECTVNSDCVAAGCSSQLCVPISLSDVVTTCEYLEEYDCLPLSHCGCYEGKCGWDQNQEYLNCLGEKSIE